MGWEEKEWNDIGMEKTPIPFDPGGSNYQTIAIPMVAYRSHFAA